MPLVNFRPHIQGRIGTEFQSGFYAHAHHLTFTLDYRYNGILRSVRVDCRVNEHDRAETEDGAYR
jgi:hypothetical protein